MLWLARRKSSILGLGARFRPAEGVEAARMGQEAHCARASLAANVEIAFGVSGIQTRRSPDVAR